MDVGQDDSPAMGVWRESYFLGFSRLGPTSFDGKGSAQGVNGAKKGFPRLLHKLSIAQQPGYFEFPRSLSPMRFGFALFLLGKRNRHRAIRGWIEKPRRPRGAGHQAGFFQPLQRFVGRVINDFQHYGRKRIGTPDAEKFLMNGDEFLHPDPGIAIHHNRDLRLMATC